MLPAAGNLDLLVFPDHKETILSPLLHVSCKKIYGVLIIRQ